MQRLTDEHLSSMMERPRSTVADVPCQRCGAMVEPQVRETCPDCKKRVCPDCRDVESPEMRCLPCAVKAERAKRADDDEAFEDSATRYEDARVESR